MDTDMAWPSDLNLSLAFDWPEGNASGPGLAGAPPAGDLSADIAGLQRLMGRLDAVTPAALSLGVAVNVLAVLALTATSLRRSPLSHYLAALGLADTLHLLACLVLWVSRHGWDIYSKVGVCQLTSFLLLMSRSERTPGNLPLCTLDYTGQSFTRLAAHLLPHPEVTTWYVR